MKNRLLNKILSLLNFEWAFLNHILVMLLSVASLLLMLFYDFSLNKAQIRFLLRLSPILVLIAAFSSLLIMIKFRSRIDKLFEAIKSVADGEFRVTVNAKDNSEYGAAYKNLSRVVDELKGSKEEMQQFTNELLHEIKTPITAISGFAEHLIETGEGIESPERMRYLQIIADESLRVSDLSQKTLMLAKVDACQIVTDKLEYNLGEQIKRCTILMLREIEKKSIELDMSVEGLTYYGNPEFMEQVWLNLIGNAVKFTPENGEISIRGTSDENGITLTFTDNGPGMDEETQEHLFEKYYQGKSGRKTGGNGIGLSIVYRIVTLCGGRITVTSNENMGSTFTVFLPSAQK